MASSTPPPATEFVWPYVPALFTASLSLEPAHSSVLSRLRSTTPTTEPGSAWFIATIPTPTIATDDASVSAYLLPGRTPTTPPTSACTLAHQTPISTPTVTCACTTAQPPTSTPTPTEEYAFLGAPTSRELRVITSTETQELVGAKSTAARAPGATTPLTYA